MVTVPPIRIWTVCGWFCHIGILWSTFVVMHMFQNGRLIYAGVLNSILIFINHTDKLTTFHDKQAYVQYKRKSVAYIIFLSGGNLYWSANIICRLVCILYLRPRPQSIKCRLVSKIWNMVNETTQSYLLIDVDDTTQGDLPWPQLRKHGCILYFGV